MKLADASHRIVTRATTDWTDERGLVVIEQPRAGRMGLLLLRALRMRTTRLLRLDAMGSQVWRLLDGRPVSDVLAALQQQYPDEDDLAMRLGHYLGTLVGQGAATLQPEDAAKMD